MRPRAKIWFVGHSDGSQLAQLGALQIATERGAAAVGGVVLFGPSRVGSRGFATFYNSLLGGKTVYYAYGESAGSSALDFAAAPMSTAALRSAAARAGSSPLPSNPLPPNCRRQGPRAELQLQHGRREPLAGVKAYAPCLLR